MRNKNPRQKFSRDNKLRTVTFRPWTGIPHIQNSGRSFSAGKHFHAIVVSLQAISSRQFQKISETNRKLISCETHDIGENNTQR